MYYPDPVDAIRKLARHVRRGGLIIFQEFDMENARSFPTAPTFDRAVGWMKQTLSATNTRVQLGLELYPVFLAAGLPAPKLRSTLSSAVVRNFRVKFSQQLYRACYR